jgi:hypothetical protein
MSAGWAVDYIMDVDLKIEDGTDLPLWNRNLYLRGFGPTKSKMYLGIQYGNESEYFDQEKEDYWLFYVHSHSAEFEIAIGGETPIRVTAKPSFRKFSDKDSDSIKFTARRYVREGSWEDNHFEVYYHFPEERNSGWNRFVAVRCPKMDNPAITVRGSGQYAALHWVGLFVKSASSGNNKFVALRTTNRLLPEYGARNRVVGSSWFSEEGGADITDRTVTLFPKQLYGTDGIDRKLYDQFVTTHPDNNVGAKHLALVNQKVADGRALPAYKYVWHASGETFIRVERTNRLSIRDPGFADLVNYIKGVSLDEKAVNGWTVLFTVFTSMTNVVTAILTGNVAGVVKGVIGFGAILDPEKMKENANVVGFITAAGDAIDAWNKEHKKKEPKPNTINILAIQQNIQQNTVNIAHFGTSPYVVPASRSWMLSKYSFGENTESLGLPEGCTVESGSSEGQ